MHIQSMSTIVSRAKPCDEIIVIGDFNLPSLFWRPSRDGFLYPDPNHSTFHAYALDLLNGYSAAGLQQINCNANKNGRCLDLCFVSINDTTPLLALAPDPLVKNVAHHPALVLSLDDRFKVEYREPRTRLKLNFRRADFDGLLNALLTVDWIAVLNPSDIDLAVNDFSSILNDLIDAFVPKTRYRSHKYRPWQSPALRRLKKLKNSALKRFSATGALFLCDHYRKLNYEYKRLRRRCYSNYRRHIEGKLRADPKKFWNFVNEQRKESGLQSTMEWAGEKADNVAAICRISAAKFSSVFSNVILTDGEISDAANNVPFPGHSMALINIDDNAILAASRKLGPDGIPATMLKKCITGLLTPLTHLFRLSLTTGRFPTTWKQAFLFPVHKKSDRSKRSCATNLLCLTSFVFASFVHRHQTDVIYTDLSAAFDKVNHRITVAKLDRYGFSVNLLCWLESYLLGRTLRVKIGDEISQPFVATSGIALGSHLGPLVFLLYLHDVYHSLKCPRLAFADNLKLLTESRTSMTPLISNNNSTYSHVGAS
ncbi:uncharacterized protein LOC129720004 [Wyeomyia smithii]|uniref:uncharacterized protein LOC129720004 n=1 Tax=Wyeomyia smithii TaxID=174621 RepID=UPI0024681A48|nr:uncharacterized protein LOC129720004 [Wyeomyia smithii]